MIVHRDLEPGVAPLVEHHRAAGRRVATVLIEDVYDEFSFGLFDPRAIRAFLRHAAGGWPGEAPTFVLLVGEANLDYRRGPPNLVPSMEIDLITGGQATSDLWFAALDDADFLPDLFLARISVSTLEQLQTVVDKTLRYASPGVDDTWRHRAIMVTDDDGAAQFEPASERLIELMPDEVTVERFYAASYPRDRILRIDIQAAVNQGSLVVNFVGHGNVDLWSPAPSGGYIFDNNAIAGLANGDKLPILTTATCMNGWFAHPFKPVSMSELWLSHPSGGGVAAWSPTGLAPVSGQTVLLQPFYAGLYDGRGRSLGELTSEAMILAYGESARWWDTIRMFSLQGDPALVASGAPAHPLPPPRVWTVHLPVARTSN